MLGKAAGVSNSIVEGFSNGKWRQRLFRTEDGIVEKYKGEQDGEHD